MNDVKSRYGEWVLIAGAAEGLGESYSKKLASEGMNLLMVDHQVDSVNLLADKLAREYGVRTVPIIMDLAKNQSSELIMEHIERNACRLLIYNAAYSRIKAFTSSEPQELDNYINVNCRTPIHLVHAFVKYLQQQKDQGGILLMSSLAGLIGMQFVAPYAASKAFAWNLAEALHHELKEDPIDVMACVAGATSTPAYLETEPNYGRFKPPLMNPDKVADSAIKNLGKKTLFIPGFSNRLSYFFLTRMIPRAWAASLANKSMAKLYPEVKV